MYVQEDNYQRELAAEADRATKTLYFVAVYTRDRHFGGPEEGGWWYDAGELVTDATIYRQLGMTPASFTDLEEAKAYRGSMDAAIDGANLNEGKHTPDSVCSEGDWLEAHIEENGLPAFYPQRRPHYE